MLSRRSFLAAAGAIGTGIMISPGQLFAKVKKGHYGVQLYSFRDAMMKNPQATLELIASIGFKEIESARSNKGLYYGLSASEMKKTCEDLGMKLVSGHVHLDKQWEDTMAQAVESGQEYLIVSSMPSRGQTIDNYKSVAHAFNKAGEECQKHGLKFGYHNHDYEFEADKGRILFDILMDETDADLVHMELDLGWVVAAGRNPLDYFKRYPGRFPLWHLKDMNLSDHQSTEFGKGALDVVSMMNNASESGVKHIFIEQEEYAVSPENSMKDNLAYLSENGF